jgi:MFS family permease
MFAVALYVPFMDGANLLYQTRFCFTQVTSGQALVVTYVVAAVFSAPLGILIDKVGYKRYFIMAAMVILTLAQIIILLYPQCPLHGSQ